MKLPRTTKLFRGHLDAAPVLCILFPLAFFGIFHSWLILPAGTRLELPTQPTTLSSAAAEPAYVVGVDAAERIFFENQPIEVTALSLRLRTLVALPGTPRMLWIQADRAVSHARLAEIGQLAAQAGIERVLLAARPTSPTP